MTVLLAEDNSVNQEYAIKVLTDMKIKVILAENGIDTLETYRKEHEKIDLILMDCRMPKMDGYQATQEIRMFEENEKIARIPIIALTANAIKGDVDHCQASGMDDYLSKPIHRQTLETALCRWLSGDKRGYFPPPSSPTLPSLPSDKILDMNIYNEMKDVMEDEMKQVVFQYLASIPAYIGMIKDALDRKSMKDIAEAAHPLKSSSASIGAMRLRNICASIEKAAQDNAAHTEIFAMIREIDDVAKLTSETLKELELS
jgi:CheY-like chemotaxis protein